MGGCASKGGSSSLRSTCGVRSACPGFGSRRFRSPIRGVYRSRTTRRGRNPFVGVASGGVRGGPSISPFSVAIRRPWAGVTTGPSILMVPGRPSGSAVSVGVAWYLAAPIVATWTPVASVPRGVIGVAIAVVVAATCGGGMHVHGFCSGGGRGRNRRGREKRRRRREEKSLRIRMGMVASGRTITRRGEQRGCNVGLQRRRHGGIMGERRVWHMRGRQGGGDKGRSRCGARRSSRGRVNRGQWGMESVHVPRDRENGKCSDGLRRGGGQFDHRPGAPRGEVSGQMGDSALHTIHVGEDGEWFEPRKLTSDNVAEEETIACGCSLYAINRL